MSAIQEKITALAPDAAYKEGQYPTFTVPSDKLREVAVCSRTIPSWRSTTW